MVIYDTTRVHAQLNRANVQTSGEGAGKLVYLYAEVLPPDKVATSTALNLALVVDRSGSMADSGKMENAKAAVRHVINEMRPTDSLSIIAFESGAETIFTGRPGFDKYQANRAVDGLWPNGGTQISRAIIAGQTSLSFGNGNQVNHMLLLTDGETQGDEPECHELAKQVGVQGISISTVGLGMDFNEQLLMGIADAARGRAHHVTNANQIQAVFAQELAGGQSVVVVNPILKLKLANGVNLRSVIRVLPELTLLKDVRPGREVDIPLADMQAGQKQSVLIELEVPSRTAGSVRIAQLVCNGASEDMVLGYVDDGALANVFNPEVMQIVDRTSVVKMQAKAAEAVAQGDTTKATRLLNAAGTKLLEMGQKDLGQAALAEAQNIQQGGKMSEAGTKKLAFGTRALSI